eukprot:m51a1_g8738 hypothetical protein (245) ;mRNA; r:29109-30124
MRTYCQHAERRPGVKMLVLVCCQAKTRQGDFEGERLTQRLKHATKFRLDFIDRQQQLGNVELHDIDPEHRLMLIDEQAAKARAPLPRDAESKGEGMLRTLKRWMHARDMRDKKLPQGLEQRCLDVLHREGFTRVVARSKAAGVPKKRPCGPESSPRLSPLVVVPLVGADGGGHSPCAAAVATSPVPKAEPVDREEHPLLIGAPEECEELGEQEACEACEQTEQRFEGEGEEQLLWGRDAYEPLF